MAEPEVITIEDDDDDDVTQEDVKPQVSRGGQEEEDEDETRTNLMVRFLPQGMGDLELSSLFVPFGPLISARVRRDPETGYSYGFGFVNYEMAADAARAIATLDGYKVQDKTLKVFYASQTGARSHEANLFVRNLNPGTNEDDLFQLFSPFGQITEHKLLYDRSTGRSRCCGFVRFSTKEEASAAIDGLRGTTIPGQRFPMEVRVAEDSRKYKSAYFASYMSDREAGVGGGFQKLGQTHRAERGRGPSSHRGSFRGFRGAQRRGQHRFNPLSN